ncbi:MAG: phospho-sugar mutase [Defluviitaleaceae bacterium]|nr:phospho-sugar mutase [Defluviitaleaceae bacterium]
METYMQSYNEWLNNPVLDADSRNELLKIKDDTKEIAERFHQNLEFGTGGLRGIIGAGTNRMNVYTVRRAGQGLAEYILAQKGGEGAKRGIVISHDNRHFSREFAIETALVMAQNGIRAYIFEDLRPTPQLSFAIRHLGCVSGVMVTASHNPPEYNGYKAYWEDGGQLVFPQDEEVIEYVNNITDPIALKVMPKEDAIEKGLLTFLGKDIDEAFLAKVQTLALNKEIVAQMADDFTVVYSPLHGTGGMPVRQALLNAGFKNVHIVKEQFEPDPNFTTTKNPNPEDPAAFAMGIDLAKQVNADIIVTNDPDADRMGAMVKNAAGEYELLSGNATGAILAEYLLSCKAAAGTLPKNAGIVSTYVSTRLTAEICKAYGARYTETLTGFKHIAKQILEWEQDNTTEFLFGFEESFGYMIGGFCRDKDAISASMLMCEAAAFYTSQNKTLFDALEDIFKKYGYFKELGHSVTLRGRDGAAKIRQMIADLRQNPPKCLAGIDIAEIRDFATYTPASDMLFYTLSDQSWFCVRPSGTEPKIKFYIGTKAATAKEADAQLAALSQALFAHMGLE